MSRIWLHQAAINGDVEALRRELAKGFAVDEYNETGMTLLHSLCSNRPGGDDDPGDRLACFHLLIDYATHNTRRRLYPLLLRAGAAFPAPGTQQWEMIQRYPFLIYLKHVAAAGGYRNYERNHLNALSATFAPKLSHLLPPEMVRRVVEYAFDVGGH